MSSEFTVSLMTSMSSEVVMSPDVIPVSYEVDISVIIGALLVIVVSSGVVSVSSGFTVSFMTGMSLEVVMSSDVIPVLSEVDVTCVPFCIDMSSEIVTLLIIVVPDVPFVIRVSLESNELSVCVDIPSGND